MRIAYLIFSYRPPAQLLRLLDTMRRGQPESPLVVHHDRFRAPWDRDLVRPMGVDVVTSDGPLTWGDFSIVAATWASLSWIVHHHEFDWVVVLSEQDYPVAPFHELELALAQSGVDAFVEAQPIDLIEDADLKWDCERRYNYQYRKIPRVGLMPRLPSKVRRPIADTANYANFVLYKLQRRVTVYRYPDPFPMRLGIRPRSSPFSSTFPCWYGSQWMALSRRAADAVLEFVATQDEIVRHYSRTVIPDESATTTIVCNDPTMRVHNGHLHRIRFSSNDGHPDVFGIEDLDYLTAPGRFFARKFDVDVDGAILDALDRRVLVA